MHDEVRAIQQDLELRRRRAARRTMLAALVPIGVAALLFVGGGVQAVRYHEDARAADHALDSLKRAAREQPAPTLTPTPTAPVVHDTVRQQAGPDPAFDSAAIVHARLDSALHAAIAMLGDVDGALRVGADVRRERVPTKELRMLVDSLMHLVRTDNGRGGIPTSTVNRLVARVTGALPDENRDLVLVRGVKRVTSALERARAATDTLGRLLKSR